MMIAHQSKSPKELISCNLHLKGSLEQWDYPIFGFIITLFNQYNKFGSLPFKGRLTDQPAKIIEIFDLLSQLDSEAQLKHKQDLERQQNKNKKGKRKRG
jgi:hypothetical protein